MLKIDPESNHIYYYHQTRPRFRTIRKGFSNMLLIIQLFFYLLSRLCILGFKCFFQSTHYVILKPLMRVLSILILLVLLHVLLSSIGYVSSIKTLWFMIEKSSDTQDQIVVYVANLTDWLLANGSASLG